MQADLQTLFDQLFHFQSDLAAWRGLTAEQRVIGIRLHLVVSIHAPARGRDSKTKRHRSGDFRGIAATVGNPRLSGAELAAVWKLAFT